MRKLRLRKGSIDDVEGNGFMKLCQKETRNQTRATISLTTAFSHCVALPLLQDFQLSPFGWATPEPCISLVASERARLVTEGFRLSTIELGIRIVAPRSLVASN